MNRKQICRIMTEASSLQRRQLTGINNCKLSTWWLGNQNRISCPHIVMNTEAKVLQRYFVPFEGQQVIEPKTCFWGTSWRGETWLQWTESNNLSQPNVTGNDSCLCLWQVASRTSKSQLYRQLQIMPLPVKFAVKAARFDLCIPAGHLLSPVWNAHTIDLM